MFRRGDFENSIKQYIETIGKVEPSFVIKKVNILYFNFKFTNCLVFGRSSSFTIMFVFGGFA
jgi:hypothetical protein